MLNLLRSVQSCPFALQHSTEAAALGGIGEMCAHGRTWYSRVLGMCPCRLRGLVSTACLPLLKCQHVSDHVDCHFRKLLSLTVEPHILFCLSTHLGSGRLFRLYMQHCQRGLHSATQLQSCL